MSSACLILVGLLFVSPFYDAANIKDDSLEGKGQQQRALVNLQSMIVGTVPDHPSWHFMNYGHFCGYGGSGDPVDPIDQCCQVHDSCYGDVAEGACQNNKNAVYLDLYNWRKDDDGTAVCEEDEDKCHYATCKCDADFVMCLKQHISSYDKKNRKFFRK